MLGAGNSVGARGGAGVVTGLGGVEAGLGGTNGLNKLGVIEEGAYADMLLVDGNPLQNIEFVAILKPISY